MLNPRSTKNKRLTWTEKFESDSISIKPSSDDINAGVKSRSVEELMDAAPGYCAGPLLSSS